MDNRRYVLFPCTRLYDRFCPPHKAAAIPATLDTTRIDDARIKAVRPLITPALLQEWLPATGAGAKRWSKPAAAPLSRVLHGQDDRLIVVVGPCSIHDHEQAMDYAPPAENRLQAQALQDELLIVMRVYFEKPRTTVGWKGYINDPHLDDSFAIERRAGNGARAAAGGAGAGLARGHRVFGPALARNTSATWSAGAPSVPAPPKAKATASWPAACPARSASKTAPMAA